MTQHLAPGPEQPPYPAEELERKVDLVISFISLRLGQWQTSGRGSYEEDWGVRAGAKVGALLFAANAAQARLPISSFYCTLVDALGEASAVESFVRWEQRTGFTLCQYPFLLSLGIKIHLLTFDGQRQMVSACFGPDALPSLAKDRACSSRWTKRDKHSTQLLPDVSSRYRFCSSRYDDNISCVTLWNKFLAIERI